MRWLVAGLASLLLLTGVLVLALVIRAFSRGGERSDETDLVVLVAGSSVLAGVFLLTVLAVTA